MDIETAGPLKVWLGWCWDAATTNPDIAVDSIISVDPDRIILWSSEEAGYEDFFNPLLDRLSPWLLSNNKQVDVIVPHVDAQLLRPNVMAHQSYGNLLHLFANYHIYDDRLSPDDITVVNRSWPSMAPRQFDKLYTCYNRRVTIERAKLIDALVRDDLLQHGIVTARIIHPGLPWIHHDGSTIEDSEPLPPVGAHRAYPSNHERGLIDIVGESFCGPGEFMVSEKTLRSILAMKPFLPLSCKGFCTEYLRDFIGLELYTEFFDYSFDSYDDIDARINGLADNLKRLSKLSHNELTYMRNRMVPKLVRNKNKLIETYLDLQKIIPQCMHFLIDGSQYQIYGKTDHFVVRYANLMMGRILF